ncbi:hypothetical protein [Mesoflavibacter zeaxanthinifaciens]|nr:hypothetical protein [Mesoflavibacter zeaxanthinifaciens]
MTNLFYSLLKLRHLASFYNDIYHTIQLGNFNEIKGQKETGSINFLFP